MTQNERRREKLKNAILYFVQNDKSVGLTKLMKLLFYLDFRLYQKYGESLTGQIYEAWQFGPVPKDVWLELHEKKDCNLNLSSVVRILKTTSKEDVTGIKLFNIPNAKFSDYYFNQREMQELKNVAEIFKECPATMLVKASHEQDQLWFITKKTKGEKAEIDYNLALNNCNSEHKEYVNEVRNDASFIENLLG